MSKNLRNIIQLNEAIPLTLPGIGLRGWGVKAPAAQDLLRHIAGKAGLNIPDKRTVTRALGKFTNLNPFGGPNRLNPLKFNARRYLSYHTGWTNQRTPQGKLGYFWRNGLKGIRTPFGTFGHGLFKPGGGGPSNRPHKIQNTGIKTPKIRTQNLLGHMARAGATVGRTAVNSRTILKKNFHGGNKHFWNIKGLRPKRKTSAIRMAGNRAGTAKSPATRPNAWNKPV